MKKLTKILIISFIALFITAHSQAAQDVSFEATVSTNSVPLGSPVQLMLTIRGTQDAKPIELPLIDGVRAEYAGPNRSVSIINGHVENTVTFNYLLYPSKIGEFSIPGFRINLNGQDFNTSPIKVDVVDGKSVIASRTGVENIEDKIFIVVKSAKDTVYVNQPVPVKVLLFYSGLEVREISFPDWDTTGFKADEFKEGNKYRQNINGVSFNVVEINTTIYPEQAGSVTLGPVKMQMNVVTSSSRRSVFNDAFFDSFFDRADRTPIVAQSQGVELNVLQVPDEGRPQDFADAVGVYEFDLDVDPKSVKEGDPITVKMRVALKGAGNISAVEMPRYENLKNFKIYDPIIKENGDVKTLEQVLIPESANIKEIPELRFSYFDVDLGKYQTIKKGPFSINVSKSEGVSSAKIVDTQPLINPAPQTEVLGQDIVFIKERPGDWHKVGYRFYLQWWFYVLLVCVMFTFVGLIVYVHWTRRISSDVVYAKKLMAPKKARQGLHKSHQFIAKKNGEMFYNEIFKTMQGYFGSRFHLPQASITFDTIKHQDFYQKVPDDMRLMIQDLFQECDMIRYAAATITEEQMSRSFSKLEQVIDYFERYVQ